MIVSGYREGNQEDRMLAGMPTLPYEGRRSSSSCILCISDNNCPAEVAEKWICYSVWWKTQKGVARSSVDMDGRCPTRSVNDMCVNSVRIVLSALIQKNDRLARLNADWHE